MQTQDIAEKLINSYDTQLISLISYGKEATQFLILIQPSDINIFQKHARALGRLMGPYQFTIMTENEFQNATDVFPIEFLDIQSDYTCHYGKNIIENLTIQLTNLRHECEFTLRSHILKLRAALLTPKPNYTRLIQESYPPLKAALTSIFHLHKKTPPTHTDLWFKELTILTTIDLTPIQIATESKSPDDKTFQAYLDTLSDITTHVDSH